MNYLLILLTILLVLLIIVVSVAVKSSQNPFVEEYLEYDKFYIIRLAAEPNYILSSEGCSSVSDSVIKTFVLLDYIWNPTIVKFGNTKINKDNEAFYLFKFSKRDGEVYENSYVHYNDKFNITHYCNFGHLIQFDRSSDLYIQFNPLLPNYVYQWWTLCDTEDCNTSNKLPVKTGKKFFLTLQRSNYLVDTTKIQYEVIINASDKKYKNKEEPSSLMKLLGIEFAEDLTQTFKLGFFLILFFITLPSFIYFFRRINRIQ